MENQMQIKGMVGDDGPIVLNSYNRLSQFETFGNIERFQYPSNENVSEADAAACWLLLNRERVFGPVIPSLRCRFEIKIAGTVEASESAHTLIFPGVAQ